MVNFTQSSRCESSGCVEIAVGADHVLVRDSKDREGPVLRFTPAEWRAFLDGAHDGEFNLPE